MKTAILLYEDFTALDAIGPYAVLSNVPEIVQQTIKQEQKQKGRE